MNKNYRQMFEEALLNQQPTQYEQMYEQELRHASQPSLAPTAQLVDSLTGSNFTSVAPKSESMRDKLAEAIKLKQAQQNQKLSGLGKLAQMQTDAEDKAEQRKLREQMMALQMRKLGGVDGKQLSANEVAKFNEANSIPMMLDDVKVALGNASGIMGPVAGRIAENNPWGDQAKATAAQLRAAAQKVGTYLEGGKLQAADEVKYANMLPQLTDTPAVAQSKLESVYRLVAAKQQSDVEALRAAGYNADPINKNLNIPELNPLVTGSPQYGNQQTRKQPSNGKVSLAGIDFNSLSDEQLDALLAQQG